MIFKSQLRSGPSDISDLRKDALIQWQHRRYFLLALFFGYIFPAVIPGLFFNDWLGGICFSAALRLTIAHHSTFCINSIAHWLGTAPYDDALTPRDHFLSAVLTMGEGYHNFHHQFPMDYRNAFLWYQYDPTKWFIALCGKVGLARHLRVFPSNEIAKGKLAMRLKELKEVQDSLEWPTPVDELPVVAWETCFIHDVSSFVDNHPGGRHHLVGNSGKEMTASFFGGVYRHSSAAHNLLSMMRVGVVDGGMEITQQEVPPVRKLFISEAERKPQPQVL
ncbi:hypothetical protein NLJ89_g7251 [Agrocybe chaxingu]|uniref:Cytochrome b5 heme-binding domain-containing protein n=1 Tax=Agrocybe chaxingu TaxID=84603 RepID=A0A9W8K4U8_9AGAR|nr:hypothetical protein NLJ89_g7251 [Agrocybe chaxingu]